MLFSVKYIPRVLLRPGVYLKTHWRLYTILLCSSSKQQLSFLVQNISHSIFLINSLSLDKFSTIKQSESNSVFQKSIFHERSSSNSLVSWVLYVKAISRQAAVTLSMTLLLWISFLTEPAILQVLRSVPSFRHFSSMLVSGFPLEAVWNTKALEPHRSAFESAYRTTMFPRK